MYYGYQLFGGVEVLNLARTAAYLKALAPGVDVKCDDPQLRVSLGHSPYTTPTLDNAPWLKGNRTAAGRFYGLYPRDISGAEDSTSEVPLTPLSASGSIATQGRHAAREIRVKATAFAADEEAMDVGLAWLRDVLAADGCGPAIRLGCTGHELSMFSALPKSLVDASTFSRTFHHVTMTDPLKVTKRLNSKTVLMWELEWVFTAGRPWPFTAQKQVAALALAAGSSHTDPAWEDCSVSETVYDDFVGDPYFTAISRPPQPPVILPPNILEIESWRRSTAQLPTSITSRWGRVVPVARIVTGASAAQFIRLRFFPTEGGLVGCGFDGEFLVSYIPANSVMTLDGIREQARLQLPDGRTVACGNLLFGSDGRPFEWPNLGCQRNYTMTADIMPGQPDVVVFLDAAIRE